jgi:DedD protein
MRQTSTAATEQQGLRDVERWKDKIEIRLDNRQVAFLFFGSALIACLLFILGVIVGKRLESRGHAMAPEIEDPLALLDRVASSLPATAVAATNRAADVAVSRAQTAPARHAVAPAEAALVPVPARALAKVEELVAAAAKAAKKPEPAVVEAAKAKSIAATVSPAAPAVATAIASKPIAVPTKSAAPAEQPRGSSPELLPPSGMAVAPPTVGTTMKDAAAAPGTAAGRARFMLQVGSFLDRAEAEAFASSFASEKPTVITSDIPGKGTWYRVRVGDFRAFKEAVDAKLSFERRFSKIALVVGPL